MNNILSKKALVAVACIVAVLAVFVLLAVSAGGSEIITEKEAKESVLKHAGVSEKDAVALDIEEEREDGKIKYEVTFYAKEYEYNYEVDGRTGEILKSEKTSEEQISDATENKNNVKDYISEDEAKAAVLKHADISEKDVRFTKVEIDDDGGYYEIDFVANESKYEYEVDVASGRIIKSEKEAINN